MEKKEADAGMDVEEDKHDMHRDLQARHLQMIAIGGTIGEHVFLYAFLFLLFFLS